MAPLGFQNHRASSSNYQGNERQPSFHELLLLINDMKKSNETRITQLENGQANMGSLMKNLENIQSTIGTIMRNMETNQTTFNATLKNLEIQMGQIAQSIKQNFSKSFPSNIEKNPEECMAITLRSGRELDDSKEVKQQVEVEKKKVKNEKKKASAKINQEEMKVDNKEKKKKKQDEVVPGTVTFPTIPLFTLHPYPSLKDLEKLSSVNNLPNFSTSSRNWKLTYHLQMPSLKSRTM